MKKIIQKYPQSNGFRTLLMAVLVLCACQTYAGDYYVSNSWISNGVGYFSLVSYDCNQSTTVQCAEANDALPPTGHYYYNQGNYFYPNNHYYQTGYGNPVECCSAAWDHVNAGQDADCGSCDGSMIVDGNYNLTGKFNVRYTYNGQTYEVGPFTTPSDITINHLCAGTYTHITIVGVYTGCEDVWPHDIVIGGGNNLHVDAGHDQTICRGESVQLCATGADHYEWSNGETGSCITVDPHQDTNYSVTGTSGDCTDTDHVSVHVNDAAWDNVEKGDDASCGSCDGSIIINGDHSVTGKFKVRYKFNGEPQQEGPFNTGSDIVLDHLCPGDYTDIKIIGVDTGCSEVWPHDITIGEEDCCPDDISGGEIVIPADGSGTPSTETTICVDGTPDPIDVEVTGVVGSNTAWVITDADLNILALPPAPPFDLDGAGIGTCLIWYLAFEDIEGAEVGANAGDLEGCFDLSNPITVDRVDCCDEEGGSIALTDAIGDELEVTICVDGTPDPLDVTVSGASATNSAWVITDADLNILALPPAPPFDLDGAGLGTCLIWYLAFDEVQGAEVGANAGDLEGCFDLSNPITVNRVECCDEEGGSIVIGGSGPDANTTATSICVDGTPDPIDVTVAGASGTDFAWVITDADWNILALPPAPPFDLDGAGEGVCLIWYLAFDEITGAEVGANAGDLSGCFDLSNPITVTRTCCDDNGDPIACEEVCEEEGGTIAIPDGASGGVDAANICVDGIPDPLDVTVSGASGTDFAWVIRVSS